MQGAGPEAQKIQMPTAQREKELAPSSKESLRAKHMCVYVWEGDREPSSTLYFKKGPPKYPHAQEAGGSDQLFPWCISVCHFGELHSVFDPL